MRGMLGMLLWLLLAATATAQVVASTSRGVVVAHGGRVELFDEQGHRLWSADGVPHPMKIVVGGDRVVVIDCFTNAMRVVGVQSGKSGLLFETGETPIDGLILGDHVYLLERDARALERIGWDGARASLTVAADPAFLRQANGSLYVYSRLDGVVQEISPTPFGVTRRVQIAPFAADFETDGRTGYLTFPADAKVRTFDLASMKATGEISAGAVPVDLFITKGGTPLSAPRLSVADPAAKRVWTIEGTQSLGAAFARGFIRGLLGLGLAGRTSADFPTGVDRVISGDLAYDSSTGALYRIKGTRSVLLAKDIAPEAFAARGDGVAVWQNGRLRIIR